MVGTIQTPPGARPDPVIELARQCASADPVDIFEATPRRGAAFIPRRMLMNPVLTHTT
jgi:hypothetical protein